MEWTGTEEAYIVSLAGNLNIGIRGLAEGRRAICVGAYLEELVSNILSFWIRVEKKRGKRREDE